MASFKQADLKKINYIYTDTSVLLFHLGHNRGSALKNKCSELIADAYNAQVPLILSEHAKQEMLQVLIRSSFKNAGYDKEDDIKYLRERMPEEYERILRRGIDTYENYMRTLRKTDAFMEDALNEDKKTHEKKIELMKQYNIFGAPDAYHLALALENGIDCFASCDSDFKNLSIPGLTILYEGK